MMYIFVWIQLCIVVVLDEELGSFVAGSIVMLHEEIGSFVVVYINELLTYFYAFL